MDGLPADDGKLVSPGFINANPPGNVQFALTAGDSGLATSIGQAGGSVTVDPFGGIAMTNSSGTSMGIDSFGNVYAYTTFGTSRVNMSTVGTIAFDPIGPGALTNVVTINGTAYPPPSGSNGTSITQNGALVACLGNGGVLISSIGGGVTANIKNAGTISFDTLGPGAITNLSTINGTAFVNGSAPYVLPSDITVSTLTARAITNLSTINGSAYPPVPYVLPSDITVSTLTAGISVDAPSYTSVSSITNATNIDIWANGGDLSLYSDNGSVKLVTGTGLVSAGNILPESDNTANVGIPGQAWSAVYATTGYISTLEGVSSINGSAYPPVPYVLPSDITVSTLTAGISVDAPSYTSVSSITGANVSLYSSGGDLTMEADSGTVNLINNTGLQVSGELKPSSDASINLGIPGQAWAEVHATTGYISTMSGVSSITSETDYLSIYAVNTLTVESADELHLKGANIQVGTSGSSTDIFLNGNTYIPTQELQVSSIVGVSSINTSIEVTDTSITTGTLHATSEITLDGGGTFSINGSTGSEGNVIAISSGYPAWVAPSVGIVASGVILNDTIVAGTWDSVGTLGQYAFSFDIGITLNSQAVVQVATWESDADEASTYWVVSCGLDAGLLRIVLAGNPSMVTTYNLSWVILSNGGTPP